MFSDKVVVVTGGGSGIGAAICALTAGDGATVIVADIELAAAERVSAALRAAGGIAVAHAVDITDTASVAALADYVRDTFGGCQFLFANAGVLLLGKLESRSAQDWQWVFDVNVFGTVRSVDAFLPLLKQHPGTAHIVVTCSMASLLASAPGKGVYNASKHAQMSYAETLRDELAGDGINVSILVPGGTQTRIMDSARNRPAALGSSAPITAADLQALIAAIGETEAAVVTPEHCIRGLRDGLERRATWIMAGSPQREKIEQRFQAIGAAFDRAAQIPD